MKSINVELDILDNDCTSHILAEFISHVLYMRGQIPLPMHEMCKAIEQADTREVTECVMFRRTVLNIPLLIEKAEASTAPAGDDTTTRSISTPSVENMHSNATRISTARPSGAALKANRDARTLVSGMSSLREQLHNTVAFVQQSRVIRALLVCGGSLMSPKEVYELSFTMLNESTATSARAMSDDMEMDEGTEEQTMSTTATSGTSSSHSTQQLHNLSSSLLRALVTDPPSSFDSTLPPTNVHVLLYGPKDLPSLHASSSPSLAAKPQLDLTRLRARKGVFYTSIAVSARGFSSSQSTVDTSASSDTAFDAQSQWIWWQCTPTLKGVKLASGSMFG